MEPCGHPQPGSWCGLAQNRIPLVLAWTHLQVQETLKPTGDNPFIFVHIHDEFMIKHKSFSSSAFASFKNSLCSCAFNFNNFFFGFFYSCYFLNELSDVVISLGLQ